MAKKKTTVKKQSKGTRGGKTSGTWKPGIKSPNPAGRPKSGNTWGDLFAAALDRQDKTDKKKTVKECIVDVATEKAKEGNPVFLDMIMKRMEGNPTQPVTGEGGGPLEVVNLTAKEFEKLRKKTIESEDC